MGWPIYETIPTLSRIFGVFYMTSLYIILPYVTGFGKTLRMGFFLKIEFDAWLISSNPCSSLRLIAHFFVEIQHFVCDRATPPIMEKLRSKGVAMHAYAVYAYYA